MSKSTQYDHEEQRQNSTDQEGTVTAPCPLCGESVSVSQVYDGTGCYSCGASLAKMQEVARGENDV